MACILKNLVIIYLFVLAACLESQFVRGRQLKSSMQSHAIRRATNSNRILVNVHPPSSPMAHDSWDEGQNRHLPSSNGKATGVHLSTEQGPSPGIGHTLSAQKREKIQSQGQNRHFGKVEDNPFTNQGPSPGIGHPQEGQKGKMQPQGQNGHFPSTTGEIDGHPSTNRGPSPGIGHSMEGQKRKLWLGSLAPKTGK
ncbi:virulence sensor protein BvgS [Striga asiatica]|uniref:Virulence sensor protein BvgS n=1 Tax=Striga asiatica TaxID=4170 RepID=A0A5A7PE07_STRAF|nr:virulence sensor protein BvgS [Striga asiatica]